MQNFRFPFLPVKDPPFAASAHLILRSWGHDHWTSSLKMSNKAFEIGKLRLLVFFLIQGGQLQFADRRLQAYKASTAGLELEYYCCAHAMDSATEDRQELVRNCQNFLVPDHEDGPYKRVLEHDVLTTEKLETGKLRLDIKLQDVQDFQQHLHQRLVTDPEAVIRAFEIAVEDTVRNLFPKTLQEDQQIKIGIVGELGPHTVSPRALSCAHISKLVRVEGIVTKCSLVRPKVVKSVHYCEKTRQFTTKEYRDVTSNSGQPTGAVYPQRDDQGNPFTTEFGLCKYKDHQTVIVQELPETAPAGQLPCSTEASSF